MATLVQYFKTSDNRRFETAEAADAHEAALKVDAVLTKYVDTLTFKATSERGLSASRNRVKKVIAGYLHWAETGEVTADAAGEDEPAEEASEAQAA